MTARRKPNRLAIRPTAIATTGSARYADGGTSIFSVIVGPSSHAIKSAATAALAASKIACKAMPTSNVLLDTPVALKTAKSRVRSMA